MFFKGDDNPDDYLFYIKILLNHEFWYQFYLNRLKMWKLWAFEYLQMDCNGSGHIGNVTQPNNIYVIKIKDKPMGYLHESLIKHFPYV